MVMIVLFHSMYRLIFRLDVNLELKFILNASVIRY